MKMKLSYLSIIFIVLSCFLNIDADCATKKKFVPISEKQRETKTLSASEKQVQPKYETPDVLSFKILSNSTKILDRFDAELSQDIQESIPKRVIFHIQDIHCNGEAQSNIAETIEELNKRYGFKLMLLEGASSRLDASFLDSFSKEVKEQVSRKYMGLGQITGPEYLLMAKSNEVQLIGYGIEDKDLYNQHLEAFNEYYSTKKKLEAYLGTIKYIFERLKDKMYSPALKNFERKVLDFKDKKLGFKEYIAYLDENAKKNNIDESKYDKFKEFVDILSLESKVDYQRANKEKDVLVSELEKLLTSEQSKQVQTNALSFKRGVLTPAEFYGYLYKTARQQNIDFKKYPQLKLYIDFITVSDRITNVDLFKQMDLIHDELKMTLAKTEPEKKLVKLVKDLEILEELASIKLTRVGVEYFNANKPEFTDKTFFDFMQEYCPKYKVPVPIMKDKNVIDASLPFLEKFYELAVKRDKALSDNIINRMDEEKADIAIVVTGGFHADGIDAFLRSKNISYVVAGPVVTKEFNEQLYYDVLTKPRPTIDDIIDEARRLEEQRK